MRWLFICLLAVNIVYFFVNNYDDLVELAVSYADQKTSAESVAKISIEDTVKDKSVMLGGFVERLKAETLQQRLVSIDIAAEIREQEDQVEYEYWVYIPSYRAPQMALSDIAKLHDLSIEAYLIGTGEHVNGISLGKFGNQDSALSLQQRMKTLGYMSEIEEQRLPSLRYWVVISEDSERLLDSKLLERLQYDYPEMKRKTVLQE